MTQTQDTNIRPMYRIVYDAIVTRNPTKGQLVSMMKDYIPAGTIHVYVGMMIRSGFIYVSPHTGQMYRTIRNAEELTTAAMQEVKVFSQQGDFMMTQVNQTAAKQTTPAVNTAPVVQATTQSTSVSTPPRTVSQKMTVEGVRPVTLDAVYTLNVGGIEIEMALSELRLLKKQIDNVVNI